MLAFSARPGAVGGRITVKRSVVIVPCEWGMMAWVAAFGDWAESDGLEAVG